MQHIEAVLSTCQQPLNIDTPSKQSLLSKKISIDLTRSLSLEVSKKRDSGTLPNIPTIGYSENPRINSSYGEDDSKLPCECRQNNYLDQSNRQEIRYDNEIHVDPTQTLLAQLKPGDSLLTSKLPQINTDPQSDNTMEEGSRNLLPVIAQNSKDMEQRPMPTLLRYSLLPPPAMTDLEFWGALVKDYNRTAQCLPTLISKKIHSGIPEPLRGIVWQSICGSKDAVLEETYDRLSKEQCSSENIIWNDIGRIFPGVDMYREDEGEGQKMLRRVLKCFGLYDEKIGFCHGIIYLAGPLLMHMGEKEAFCVLVRLMEKYDMRSCFLSDHSGLHLRAFQYHQLLKNHIPTLSKHLDTMQIEPTYFYRWILSIFAVTCPLPMLLRIYDLVFAEGVLQVIMRVAISLMRKNEARIVTYKDPEHISQLLNSRGLWDVYHYNADEFVTEITSLSDIVTNHTLQSLEASYRELPDSERFVSIEKLGSSPAGFFGKSWSRPNTSSKLSGGGSEQSSSEQSSEFRRTSSKNSFASTFNSNEGVGSNSMMSSETDLTSVSIDSVNPQRTQLSYQSNKTNHIREDLGRNLHNQIEALLTALNGLQKENAMLVKQLSAQREERNSDRDIILNLLENLRNNMTMQKHSSNQSDDMGQKSASIENGYENNVSLNNKVQYHLTVDSEDQLLPLLDAVESHFLPSLSPRVTLLPTRLQLEDEIARVKEQLKSEISKTQDLDKQLIGQNQEIKTLREQVKQVQLHIRNKHDENQRLERVIRELRSERDTRWRTNNIERGDPSSPIDHGATGSANIGLRRLRLIHERERQSKPTLSQNNNNLLEPSLTRYEKKDQALSPMASPSGADAKNTGQDEEYENLLEKYVLAKTAEAMSREEAEELRDKVESLKKLIDQISKDTPLSVLPKSRTSNSNNSPTGLTGSSTGLNKNDIRSSISSISAVISGAMNPSSKDTPILAATVSNDATSNNSSFGFVSNYFTGSQSETKSLSASAPTDKAGLTVTETSGASIAKSGEINSNGAFAFASNYFNGPKVGTKILPAALTPSTNFEKVVKNTPISIQGKNAPTGFWSGWGKKVQISG